MDDELPSRGREKLNKTTKLLLMLVLGLFFSVCFGSNSSKTILADNHSDSVLAQSKEVDVSGKTTLFKFDPMEKVKNSVEGIKLAKRKEKQKKAQQLQRESEPENSQRQKYQELVAGSPLEAMVPFIAKCDSETAAFLIAIAKKESDFGRHSPKKEGTECFNYWGYRGSYNQTDSGYSCFDSPEQAISVVGERIRELIDRKIDTAEKLIVWKCGSTCAGHDPAGVRKWISDVALYHAKANS
jgi:hypothetical protein